MAYSLVSKLKKARLATFIFILALIFCLPYLTYTYSLTGKIFYWSDLGGDNLYWMSTPYKNEFGDWYDRYNLPQEIQQNHQEFFDKISKLNRIEADEALKKEAIQNIKKHPKKYFMNWLANIGRIFFSYPYSYTNQSLTTYFTILPNMFIVVLGLPFFFITVMNRKIIHQEIFFLLCLVPIYLFGSSLLSAGREMFFVTLPVVGLWLAYIFDNFIQIKLCRDSK